MTAEERLKELETEHAKGLEQISGHEQEAHRLRIAVYRIEGAMALLREQLAETNPIEDQEPNG